MNSAQGYPWFPAPCSSIDVAIKPSSELTVEGFEVLPLKPRLCSGSVNDDTQWINPEVANGHC